NHFDYLKWMVYKIGTISQIICYYLTINGVLNINI
ncbi:unnamed protein product, partial [marine sediment metagenome]